MSTRLTFFGLLSLTLLLAGCSSKSTETNSPKTADVLETTTEPTLLSFSADVRTSAEQARDRFRHPEQTLQFFDVQPNHTVVEIWPGGGWYTAILAPYLRDQGKLVAAHWPTTSKVEYFQKIRANFDQRFSDKPDVFGDITIVALEPPAYMSMGEVGQADRVLTFRNVHNWMRSAQEQAVFDTAFSALKSGGILGVVEHRAPESFTREQMIDSGYVSEAYVTELATNAGFEPYKQSEINANPKDTHMHPAGVWTLPPSLRLGDKDREKYLEIGESDRMTLSFRKP
ncbi:MAG: methyltransferase [Oleibacter sp.]|nr:methyltransferase [Thalassolituus sp.]